MELLQAAAPYGFAALVAAAVLVWTGKRVDRNEQRQNDKYDVLEKFVREELFDLCEKQGLLVQHCTSVLERLERKLEQS